MLSPGIPTENSKLFKKLKTAAAYHGGNVPDRKRLL
jgi:hypothetical protein